MFKVNNKNTRTTFSSVYIDDIEQVNFNEISINSRNIKPFQTNAPFQYPL